MFLDHYLEPFKQSPTRRGGKELESPDTAPADGNIVTMEGNLATIKGDIAQNTKALHT